MRCGALAVPGRGQAGGCREDAARIEARIHFEDLAERLDEQAGAGRQEQGERHLGHHQRAARSALPRAFPQAAAALLERALYVPAGSGNGRRQPEQQAGGKRNREREPEHSRIDVCFAQQRISFGTQQQQGAQSPVRQPQAQGASAEAEQRAFRKQLPHHLATSGARA